MIFGIILALLLLAACKTHGTELRKEGCRRIISDAHITNLSELIDSQMKSSCLVSIDYVDGVELDDPVCFLKAAYTPLGNILKHKMAFKRNTPNFNKLEQLKHIYDKLERDSCIIPDDEEEKKNCIKTFTLTAEDMLRLVLNYFKKAQQALSLPSNFDKDCSHLFEACSSQERTETSTADEHRKNSEPRDIQGKAVIYVAVASVLGILLAVGGLLFYLHRSRILARRRLQRTEYMDRQEGRPLNREEEHVELQIEEGL